jgi:tetrahydromethanopterin S-methyltransferase subunit F
MWKRLKDKNNVFLSRDTGLDAGGMVMRFNGIPIRTVEQISLTETAIS